MKNFNFKNTTEILFGKQEITAAKSRVPEGAKVLILYGGGSIKKNGVYDDVMALFETHQTFEFSGIEPNPSYETLMKAVAVAQANKIDFILAVGGGSVIDGAKFVAAAIDFDGEPWDLLAKHAPVQKAVPLGVVLTLPATGSESNSGAVITKKSTQEKLSFASEKVLPAFAVLDPVYTFSLPEKQTANGVVDAFVHTLEQYMTYPVNAKIQDRFAEGILSTLLEEGPKALLAPKDYGVRANIMWSATLALNGLIGQGVPHDWATHIIGHELTALYGLDHGQTLAIVMPSLLQVQREQKKAKIIQFAERVLKLTDLNEEDMVTQGIEGIRDFFESMGIKTRLSDYQVPASAVDEIVNKMTLAGRLKLGEHRDITPEVIKEILTQAL